MSKLGVVFGLSEKEEQIVESLINDLDKLGKEYPEIEITGLSSTFSEVCTPLLRIIKDEFLKAVIQWYDETEPEDFDIDELEVEERVLFDDVDFIIRYDGNEMNGGIINEWVSGETSIDKVMEEIIEELRIF
jgi:hypothetical protein